MLMNLNYIHLAQIIACTPFLKKAQIQLGWLLIKMCPYLYFQHVKLCFCFVFVLSLSLMLIN